MADLIDVICRNTCISLDKAKSWPFNWHKLMFDVSFRKRRHMCSARSGNGPTRVNTMTNSWKMNLLEKENTEFWGENFIDRNLNMCFIKQRSVGEHFFLLTMEFYVKQSVCKSPLFSPSCFTDGHEAENTFGMVKRRFAQWRLYSSAECTSLRVY